MTLEEALPKKLETVLGQPLACRVFPDVLPMPVPITADLIGATYSRTGDDHLVCLDTGRDRTRIDTYAVDLYHPSRAVLEVARDALFDAFGGANAQGYWGGPQGTGVYVAGAIASDAQAEADPPANGSDKPTRGERVNVRIIWTKGR